MTELKVVVAGAGGRMGTALVRMVTETEGMHVAAALDRTGTDCIGADVGTLAGIGALGVAVGDQPLHAFVNADVVLDFTVPAATVELTELSAQARMVHVIGTTGLSPDDQKAIDAAARHARIVQSGNMSLGVNLLAGLVQRAAAALDDGYDIEILEMHHRHKVDAPSGTALLLGRAAAEGRGVDPDKASLRARDGITGPRPKGAIGFATLRGGSVVGDHTVILAGEGERIELAHKGENRSIYARGAVCAAQWAFDKKPGLYSMADVLGVR